MGPVMLFCLSAMIFSSFYRLHFLEKDKGSFLSTQSRRGQRLNASIYSGSRCDESREEIRSSCWSAINATRPGNEKYQRTKDRHLQDNSVVNSLKHPPKQRKTSNVYLRTSFVPYDGHAM